MSCPGAQASRAAPARKKELALPERRLEVVESALVLAVAGEERPRDPVRVSALEHPPHEYPLVGDLGEAEGSMPRIHPCDWFPRLRPLGTRFRCAHEPAGSCGSMGTGGQRAPQARQAALAVPPDVGDTHESLSQLLVSPHRDPLPRATAHYSGECRLQRRTTLAEDRGVPGRRPGSWAHSQGSRVTSLSLAALQQVADSRRMRGRSSERRGSGFPFGDACARRSRSRRAASDG